MTRDPRVDRSPESELAQLRRLRDLDGLLPTLTDVLDLRQVFEKVAAIAKGVLPHALLIVTLVAEDGENLEVYAEAGGRPAGSPDRIPFTADAFPPEPWEHEIVADLQTETTLIARTLKVHAARAGWHGMLRLPIRLGGRLVGALTFHARERGAYGSDDLLVANRIRDHVALALSHSRLAEEARRTAAVRERAVSAEARVKVLTDELAAVGGHGRVIGVSRSWKAALEQASKVAPTETTVLVTGESGTGKEVMARFIHRGSPRAEGPFVAINCAAIPEQLLESELFGFEKGAFSGAAQAKPGLIERAAGGVLFLDEIGEMGLSVQSKLLRFLQEREFQRLGGLKPLKANVRVVTATNRDLRAASERGTFREDLYYRVSVFEIRTPPLRERPDDILPLSEVFLEDLGRSLGRPAAGISKEARERLLAYRWPGNVRELRNVLERASILSEGGLITGEHLAITAQPPKVAPLAQPAKIAEAPETGVDDIAAVERSMIERVLKEVRYNKSLAAKRLGLTRGQLYTRLKKHGLE